jgi:NTE family protein
MLTGKPYVFDHGPLCTALQASAAIPWLRKPVMVDGRLLNDGVLAANLPIKQARDMGADVVICVDIDGPVKKAKPEVLRHIKTMRSRTATLVMSKLDEASAKQADVVLHPDVADIDILSTKPDDVQNAIAAGEKVARDAMPRIRKLAHLENPKNVQSAIVPSVLK